MADLKKLEKQVGKAKAEVETTRTELDKALQAWGDAVAAHAVATEAYEHAEALEAAMQLRAKK